MHLGMALRAFGGISHFETMRLRSNGITIDICEGATITHFTSMEVKLVALETQEGLILHQKIIGDRTVGIMADRTIFHHRFMLKSKRTLVAGVTFETKIIQPFFGLEAATQTAVRLMTVRTHYISFLNRMVRRVQRLYFNLQMAFIAESGLGFNQEIFCLGVALMTIDTPHII